jgi:hypothetical protein
MGQLDTGGLLTLQELMVTALATADAVAKLLIEKGIVTDAEFKNKVLEARSTYQGLLQQVMT